MNISPVSFTKHIPFMNLTVKDTNSDSNIGLTFSDLDCTDLKDIYDIDDIPSDTLRFRECIMLNMVEKYKAQGYSEMPGYERDFINALFFVERQNNMAKKNPRFYVLESPKTGITGLCQTHKEDNKMFVDYISSRADGKYKYTGQTMLAAIGKQALTDGCDELVINNPVNKAVDFYTKKCGFERKNTDKNLYMGSEKIKNFIHNVEDKTQSSIDFIC